LKEFPLSTSRSRKIMQKAIQVIASGGTKNEEVKDLEQESN